MFIYGVENIQVEAGNNTSTLLLEFVRLTKFIQSFVEAVNFSAAAAGTNPFRGCTDGRLKSTMVSYKQCSICMLAFNASPLPSKKWMVEEVNRG